MWWRQALEVADTRITDEGMHAILDSSPRLRRLDVSNCPHVSEASLVSLRRGEPRHARALRPACSCFLPPASCRLSCCSLHAPVGCARGSSQRATRLTCAVCHALELQPPRDAALHSALPRRFELRLVRAARQHLGNALVFSPGSYSSFLHCNTGPTCEGDFHPLYCHFVI